MPRRALAPLLIVLPACSSAPVLHDHDRTSTSREPFTSAGAALVQLDFDTSVVTQTIEPAALENLIEAQLLFTVGQLNGDRSVGRVDRSDYKVTTLSHDGQTYEVGYHVTMPVAWGQPAVPSTYGFVLPRRVDAPTQAAFATKYGGACTDPEGGDVDDGDVFLFFRPRRPGCALAPDDVVATTATVTAAGTADEGKYPEYHRVWEDGELVVVAVFGRELADGSGGGGPSDEGAQAYRAFLDRARSYLAQQKAASATVAEEADPGTSDPNVRLATTLPDGRKVRVDVISVGPSLRTDGSLDPWYDARTPDADLVVYSGHAGLGDNVRALVTKGVFRPKKYLVNVVNGCDTFAYVDDTLAVRRAALNPDDPGGSRYMDSITNVLGGYFHSEADTTMLLLDAFVSAAEASPKRYREIFSAVDPTQIMLVTGEEDNEFAPSMMPVAPAHAAVPPAPAAAANASRAPPPAAAPEPASTSPEHHRGCAAGPLAPSPGGPELVLAVLGAARAVRRRKAQARGGPSDSLRCRGRRRPGRTARSAAR
jgi:hypothetical protein